MADGQTDPAPGGHVTSGEKKEHNKSSGSIDDSKPEDRKVQEKSVIRRRWDKLSGAGKTLTVAIPTIAAALSILTNNVWDHRRKLIIQSTPRLRGLQAAGPVGPEGPESVGTERRVGAI
jgi:hypothetical protein